MTHSRQKGFIFSALLHFCWLILAIFGLPLLATKQLEEPTAVTVELLPISNISNVKPSDSQPAEQEKPEDKKQEPKKPTPPVKTADDTPPPPPPQPSIAKLPPKPEEKKPEKKPEEKKKPKQDDLAAVLKAVKDTAQKKTDTDKSKDASKSKSISDNYNPDLPMSLSEKDAIASQFEHCWSPPIGAKDAHNLAVLLDIEFAQDGTVLKVELASASKARYNSDTFFRAAADSAIRAAHECSPLKNLPTEKYDTWHMMEVNFDPKDAI